MMDIPSYVDLGKQAHDVFTQGYHFGYWRFDCKAKVNTGIEFITCAQSSPILPHINGAFAIKHRVNRHDLILMEKWCTYDTVVGKLETQDNICKLVMEGLYNYKLGEGKAKIGFWYGVNDFKTETDLNISSDGVLINASIVLRFGNWLAGYQTAIKGQSSHLDINNFALTYHIFDEEVFHGSVNTDITREGTDYMLSYFKRCSNKLDLGIQVSWTSGGISKIGLGIRKHLNENEIFRAMVNNDRQIGIGYQLALLDGFNLFLSALIDSKDGKSQLGIAVEIEI